MEICSLDNESKIFINALVLFVVGGYSGASKAGQVIQFPDGRVRCKLCDKIFKSLVTAQKHIEVQHTEQKRICCSICKRILNNKYSFRSHVNLKHKIFGKDIVRCYGTYVEDDNGNPDSYAEDAIEIPYPHIILS